MQTLAWIGVASIVLACLITLITEARAEAKPVLLVQHGSDVPAYNVQVRLNRHVEHRTVEQRLADQARVDRLGFP